MVEKEIGNIQFKKIAKNLVETCISLVNNTSSIFVDIFYLTFMAND